MRLKQNVLMILLLTVLLGIITLGLATRNDEPSVIEETPVEEEMPDSFKGTIKNGENIPSEIIDLICNYMDDYFESMYTLEQVSTSEYFENDIQAAISDYSIKMLIDSRKKYGEDFSIKNGHYDLNIEECVDLGDGTYKVYLLEDDYLNFRCLDGITSETLGVENNYVFKKVDGQYKIESLEKVQSQNIIFDENEINSVDDVKKIYEYYFNNLMYHIEKEETYKVEAQSQSFVASKIFNIKYDRDAAVAYVEKYWKDRNDAYVNFSESGGNCQNLASQALVAGGAVMDTSGEYQWYYNDSTDNTMSWRTVYNFEKYVDMNEGSGVVLQEVDNIYYAEPGDVVHVGHSTCSHATIVSKIVNGHILLNSNSIDMKDYPLEAYVYATRKLYKVLGSNS